MTTDPQDDARGAANSIEREELRGISRTVAEIHWLLVILVLLYVAFGSTARDEELAITAALWFYPAFVMSFRYANFYRQETRWKIAIECWTMLAFITWVLSFTGGLASPLLNTYLLPVIVSALTLGKVTTLLQVGLIAACSLFLGSAVSAEQLVSLAFYGGLVVQLVPVVLVAYVTTMFSADIRYGLNQAKLLAGTDELTGVFNKRGFAISASRLFAQAQRYKRPATILMIDSDNLKAVNDRHGHAAGDRLLKTLARCIQAELRYTDVPGRFGGDEFIVLLPETPAIGAMDVAERIRDAFASSPVNVDGTRVECTVSIGVASYPEDGGSIDAVTARADRAMYQGKQQGRNRVVRFQPD